MNIEALKQEIKAELLEEMRKTGQPSRIRVPWEDIREEILKVLAELGLQYQVEDSKGRKMWRLTDEGKQYGEEMPFERNGHTGYQIRWTERIVDLIPTEGE